MGTADRPEIPRRAFAAAAALVALAGASACTRGDEHAVELAGSAPTSTVLPGEDLAATALALSAVLYESADIAVLASEETVDGLAPLSSRAGIPLLVGTDRAVAEEISRLGVTTAITAEGGDLSALEELGEDLEILEVDPAEADAQAPEVRADGSPVPVTLFVDPRLELPAQAIAAAMIGGAGGTVAEIPGGEIGRASCRERV